MKSYTSLEQSKKLAKILPFKSADMRYAPFGDTHPWAWDEEVKLLEKGSIPCWSLAALLSILPKNLNIGRPSLESNYKGYYWIQYYDEFMKPNNYKTECFNNSVDACYEMVLKLHELNLL